MFQASSRSVLRCTQSACVVVPQICSLLDVDGIRGDMVVNRAAKALVALEDRKEVTLEDVARVIALCLNHRYSLFIRELSSRTDSSQL